MEKVIACLSVLRKWVHYHDFIHWLTLPIIISITRSWSLWEWHSGFETVWYTKRSQWNGIHGRQISCSLDFRSYWCEWVHQHLISDTMVFFDTLEWRRLGWSLIFVVYVMIIRCKEFNFSISKLGIKHQKALVLATHPFFWLQKKEWSLCTSHWRDHLRLRKPWKAFS